MRFKKTVLRLALIVGSLVVALAITAIVVVHTPAFNRFLIRKIAEATASRTGEDLTIGKLAIDWRRLDVALDGLVLRSPSSEIPPFLVCDRVEVGLKILSIWKRKIILSELIAERPVVRIVINSQGGNNLPHSSSHSTKSTSDTLIDLGIRHFILKSGEVDYNSKETPLAADLQDVQAQVQFDAASQSYRGLLAYDHGRVAAAEFAPFEHGAQIEFEARRSSFQLTSLQVATANSNLAVKGIIADFSRPRIQASYEASLFTPELARILKTSIPEGMVHTVGSVQYDYEQSRAFLESVRVDGSADTSTLDVAFGQFLARARNVRARYALRDGSIDVRDLVAEVLGGTASGTFAMTNLSGHPFGRLSASIRGASLAELSRAVPADRNERIILEGRTNADVQSAWKGAFSNGTTHLRATVAGPLTVPARDAVPINASLDVRYDGRQNTTTFAPSSITTESAQVSFHGTVSKHSSLAVQANTGNLAEITQLVSSFGPHDTKSGPPFLATLGLQGSATFAGQIQGSLTEPRVQGHVTGTNVVVRDASLASIRADITLSSSALSIQHCAVDLPNEARLTADANAQLRHWLLTSESNLSLQATVSRVSLSDMQRIANLRYPVSGNLNASVSLHGSENNPAGKASIDISNASAWNQSLKQLAIRLRGDSNLVDAEVQAQTSAGTISTEVQFSPKSHSYQGQLQVPNLNLEKISLPALRKFEARGTAAISASGKGSTEHPQLNAEIKIPQLQIRDQEFAKFDGHVNVASQHASLVVESTVIGRHAQAKADVDLAGDYSTHGSVDVQALPIGPALASYIPRISNAVQGETELHATLDGPLKQPDKIRAHLQIPSLNVTYQSVRLGLADPLQLDYANDVLSIVSADITGTGTRLSIRGTIPLKQQKPMNITANGTMDLALLQSFNPGVRSSGQIHLQINGGGNISSPTAQGQIQVQNATFSSETFPIALEGISGQIRIAGNRMDIEHLGGMAGGGNLTASGFLIYGKQTSFGLSAHAQSVRLRYPEGLRTLLDADLNLTGSPANSTLAGRVLIDRLSFTNQFDMSTLIGELSSNIPSTAPPPLEENMKLNVALASSNQLNVTGSKISIGGSANLTVGGTIANPVILGRMVLTQGEVFFLGKRYELQSGTIAFSNPIRTEPVLNIYAKTTVQQYNITINFIGPVDRLHTNYTSDPPLSEADIIHLVAFGTTAEEAATATTPTNLAAESVVAQGVSSQVSSRLEKLTGISQITLDPLVTNSSANPASQIAVQQRVSGSLLVTFSADVTSTQNQVVEVQYKLQKNVMVSVIRDYNGGYALDVRIRKNF